MAKRYKSILSVTLLIACVVVLYLAMKRADSLPFRGLGRGW
jgi:hypothetical protein